tara:strand:- start:35306 stop:36715 length:1410 start_codon:yes stop_codon:yes gene_type:complete
MRAVNLQQLADTIGGQLQGTVRNGLWVDSISSDTRLIKKGDVFIALQGANFDANRFIDQAQEKGAAAAIVSADISNDLPHIKVNDTLQALTVLARAERDKTTIPVVAITGSNGKTSVKEMLASIIAQHKVVLATDGNLNNHIGVPLTLLKLNEKHQVAIIEMGASHKGEIQHLCAIAQPTTSILNNVGEAHLEGFGDLQGVASAKAEIITGLSASGTVVLNKEEPWFDQWLGLAGDRRVISFGWSSEADVWAEKHSLESGLLDGQFKTRFVMHYQQQSVTVELNLLGEHNILNALAAASAALSLGVSLDDIATGLAKQSAVKGRMQALKGLVAELVINDCYNANPKSFEAAMACLSTLKQETWLVLGDFAELGKESQQIHRQLGVSIANSAVRRVYAVGEMMRSTVEQFNQLADSEGRQARHFPNKQALAEALQNDLTADVVVLVKGSRSQGLDSVVDKIIIKEAIACC